MKLNYEIIKIKKYLKQILKIFKTNLIFINNLYFIIVRD